MHSVQITRVARQALVAVTATFILGAAVQSALAEGPFAGLSGSWEGNGTVAVSNGSKERIRCRASYSVAPSGEKLHQELRCASDSYKFEVNSNVIAGDGGSLSGTWTELTRQVTGAVSGKVAGERIDTKVNGPAFSATLVVETKGNHQSVSIQPQGSTEITAISIEMTRG